MIISARRWQWDKAQQCANQWLHSRHLNHLKRLVANVKLSLVVFDCTLHASNSIDLKGLAGNVKSSLVIFHCIMDHACMQISTLIVVQDPVSLQPRKRRWPATRICEFDNLSVDQHLESRKCILTTSRVLAVEYILQGSCHEDHHNIMSYPTRWSLLFILGSVWIILYFNIQASEKYSAAMYYCLSVCVRREIGGET